MDQHDREGLSLGYRFIWRLKYVGMHVFGPAQLGDDSDPQRASSASGRRRSRRPGPLDSGGDRDRG